MACRGMLLYRQAAGSNLDETKLSWDELCFRPQSAMF
jgi:hypothetical protein